MTYQSSKYGFLPQQFINSYLPIPKDNVDLHSKIHPGTFRAELIDNAEAIVWEELTGANIAAVQCANKICRQIKQSPCVFGGIPFVGLGDFRQIPPVVKGIGPTPAIEASIKSSPLWQEFTVYTLDYPHRTAGDPEYTAFIDHIGEDYKHPMTSLHLIDCITTLDEAQQFLFPPEVLHDPFIAIKRAFLSPLNSHVDEFNEKMLHCLPGNLGKQYIHSIAIVLTDFSLPKNPTTALMSSKKTTVSVLTTTLDSNFSLSSITTEFLYITSD